MSAQTQAPALTFEELLEQEEKSPVRHEYIGGRLYAMAGGSPAHVDIVLNIGTAVQSRLRGSGCRGSGNDQRVRTSESATNWYHPDLLIKCPPYRFHPQDRNALLNPSAIFEVLSPSTEVFDRTGKFDEYKLISEFRDYILIDAARVRVEHFTKLENGEWVLRVFTNLAQELLLTNFDISVSLSEIYEDIELSAQSILPKIIEE